MISERYLSDLDDIAYIDVIRGPGSAIYGPGAINGVISIQTHTAKSVEGTRVNLRQGLEEKFSTIEIQKNYIWSNDRDLYVYLGIDDYDGADPDDAPLVFSKQGDFFSAGQRIVDENIVNDNSAWLGSLNYKAHLNYRDKDFEFSMRSTRNGRMIIFISGNPKFF